MAITATAAVLRAPGGPLSVEEVVVEDPRPDEVLVRIVGSGICHTDLGIVTTASPEQLPLILGHEGSGVIEAVGDRVTTLAPGDHVVLSYAYCGECDNCRRGVQRHCRSFMAVNFGGGRADGTTAYRAGDEAVHGHFFGQSSWSRYVVTSPRNVVKVDASLPLELLGPLGCGIQTGAGAVLNTLDPEPGSSLAVFAAGSVGLAAVMAAKAAGCASVIAVDPQPDRRALALELGATHALDSAGPDVVEEIREITQGGAQYSVDCLGLPSVVRQALECLASPGVCASVGFQGVDNEVTLNQGHLLFGRTLIGVIEGDADPHTFVPRMLDLFQAKQLPFDRLVQTFPIGEINEAVEAAHQGQVVKAVITFGH
ncbi:NAD(P)-dependent alcohol dehydrogenase [Streptomyces sp. NPDC048290]|uniref:NAD(P)-dependent alcohol dehydrogenase n=1 Tax=Streptomyces sp. NPDC048290 TaxID=3155811 RepID=UPI00341CFE1E